MSTRGPYRPRGWDHPDLLALGIFIVIFFLSAGVAALWARLAVGIYGVMSYHVGTRQRETAIRRALGAHNTRLVGDVLKEGLILATLGAALGLIGAVALARSFRTLLFDVSPTDLTTYTVAALSLIAVAAAACVIPSVRATRVDPVAALREE